MINDNSDVLVLDWHKLSGSDINERLDWLRRSAVPGTDWGYCSEYMTCVLKNQAISTMYRLRWFESGQQTVIDGPVMMTNPGSAMASLFGD